MNNHKLSDISSDFNSDFKNHVTDFVNSKLDGLSLPSLVSQMMNLSEALNMISSDLSLLEGRIRDSNSSIVGETDSVDAELIKINSEIISTNSTINSGGVTKSIQDQLSNEVKRIAANVIRAIESTTGSRAPSRLYEIKDQ